MKKENFKQKLKELNLNLKEFSEISNTPYSTVRNWGYKPTKDSKKEILIPGWVEPMLEYYKFFIDNKND